MSTCEYTFDNVVRIVIVSIVITLLIVGFFISIVWLYLCKRNSNKFKFGMYFLSLSLVSNLSLRIPIDINQKMNVSESSQQRHRLYLFKTIFLVVLW